MHCSYLGSPAVSIPSHPPAFHPFAAASTITGTIGTPDCLANFSSCSSHGGVVSAMDSVMHAHAALSRRELQNVPIGNFPISDTLPT